MPDGIQQLKITRPICVVDCGFIQRCKGESDDVPAHWDCLVIGTVFAEHAMKRDDQALLLRKLSKWMKRNSGRLWAAHDLVTLTRRHEWTPLRAKRIGLRELISLGRTAELRELAASDGTLQVPSSLDVHRWLENGDRGRQGFMALTNRIREHIASLPGRPSEKLPHTDAEIRDYVRQFPVEKLVVHRDGKGRYGDSHWRKHVRGFPDRLLIAKRARLDLYYGLRRALGDSRKFDNNWDDMHYAVCASITGHIATHDSRLAMVCEILAPGIRVHPRPANATP